VKKSLGVITILILLSLSLLSCKMNQDINTKDLVSVPGGLTSDSDRNFTPSELEIGRRICSNLKTKRERYESGSYNKQFRFRSELRNCDDGVWFNQLFLAQISNLNTNGPEYVSTLTRDNYISDIVTDQTAVLRQVCDSMIVTDSVSNTIKNGNFKYTLRFLIVDNYDRYELIKNQKDSNGNYTPISAEAVSLITQSSPFSREYLGVEKERSRYSACDARRFKTMKQTWIEGI